MGEKILVINQERPHREYYIMDNECSQDIQRAIEKMIYRTSLYLLTNANIMQQSVQSTPLKTIFLPV